jgi:hypothetical protein
MYDWGDLPINGILQSHNIFRDKLKPSGDVHMRYFSTLSLALALTLIVSACGAQPTPTAPPVDIQSSAVAAAFTMVAQTQAAIPTATPVPPTETPTNTPAVTDTAPPLPAAQVTSTPAPNSAGGGDDPCVNKVMPTALQGKTVRIRINNSTKAALAVSVYLNSMGSQSQCGYRVYNLGAQEFIVLNDLVEGCYTLWAWNPIPEDYFIVTNGTSCVDTSDTWVFDITTRSISART